MRALSSWPNTSLVAPANPVGIAALRQTKLAVKGSPGDWINRYRHVVSGGQVRCPVHGWLRTPLGARCHSPRRLTPEPPHDGSARRPPGLLPLQFRLPPRLIELPLPALGLRASGVNLGPACRASRSSSAVHPRMPAEPASTAVRSDSSSTELVCPSAQSTARLSRMRRARCPDRVRRVEALAHQRCQDVVRESCSVPRALAPAVRPHPLIMTDQ